MTLEVIMSSLAQFADGVIAIWEVAATFITSHPICMLSLFAWLFVMAVGGLFKLFKV